jgi:hypothetical protein
VKEEHRRCGIGGLLLDRVFQLHQERRLPTKLKVHPDNTGAIALYVSKGFNHTSEKSDDAFHRLVMQRPSYPPAAPSDPAAAAVLAIPGFTNLFVSQAVPTNPSSGGGAVPVSALAALAEIAMQGVGAPGASSSAVSPGKAPASPASGSKRQPSDSADSADSASGPLAAPTPAAKKAKTQPQHGWLNRIVVAAATRAFPDGELVRRKAILSLQQDDVALIHRSFFDTTDGRKPEEGAASIKPVSEIHLHMALRFALHAFELYLLIEIHFPFFFC